MTSGSSNPFSLTRRDVEEVLDSTGTISTNGTGDGLFTQEPSTYETYCPLNFDPVKMFLNKVSIVSKEGGYYLRVHEGNGSVTDVEISIEVPIEELVVGIKEMLKKKMLGELRGILIEVLKNESLEFKLAFYKAAIDQLKREN